MKDCASYIPDEKLKAEFLEELEKFNPSANTSEITFEAPHGFEESESSLLMLGNIALLPENCEDDFDLDGFIYYGSTDEEDEQVDREKEEELWDFEQSEEEGSVGSDDTDEYWSSDSD